MEVVFLLVRRRSRKVCLASLRRRQRRWQHSSRSCSVRHAPSTATLWRDSAARSGFCDRNAAEARPSSFGSGAREKWPVSPSRRANPRLLCCRWARPTGTWHRSNLDARYYFRNLHGSVFRGRGGVCLGVRPPEIEFEVRERNDMLGNIVLLAISILTGAYLLAALLWPERF